MSICYHYRKPLSRVTTHTNVQTFPLPQDLQDKSKVKVKATGFSVVLLRDTL